MSQDILCSECGGACDVSISQWTSRGRLVWGAALKCVAHDHAQEEIDGAGVPPPDFRSRILADTDVYELILGEDVGRVIALRQMQKALDLSMKVLVLLRKNLPGAVVSGTRYEMGWLANTLDSQGVSSSVRPRDLSRGSPSFDIALIVPPDWDGCAS